MIIITSIYKDIRIVELMIEHIILNRSFSNKTKVKDKR